MQTQKKYILEPHGGNGSEEENKALAAKFAAFVGCCPDEDVLVLPGVSIQCVDCCCEADPKATKKTHEEEPDKKHPHAKH